MIVQAPDFESQRVEYAGIAELLAVRPRVPGPVIRVEVDVFDSPNPRAAIQRAKLSEVVWRMPEDLLEDALQLVTGFASGYELLASHLANTKPASRMVDVATGGAPVVRMPEANIRP